MSFQVTTAFVQAYDSMFFHLSQQKGSRLRDTVRMKPAVPGQNVYFERIGKVEPQEITTRYMDTPITSTPHTRRRVSPQDFVVADFLMTEDELRLLIDPRQGYTEAQAYGMGRQIDRVILLAATGNSFTTVDGSVAVALPAAQIVASSSTGLTLAKLLSAKQILDTADVDPDEPRWAVVTAKQITDLLNTTEIKNADYNSVKALAEGAVDTFLGFKFIRTQLPLEAAVLNGSGETQCLFYATSAIGLTVPQDVKSEIDKRPDKLNSWQVMTKATMGSTRIEDEKLVSVACV